MQETGTKGNALLLKTVTRDSLVNDNKVKYYTVLPSFEALNALIDFASVGVPSSFVGGPCDVFEQITMTLMRLRLNLDICDVDYRHGVHESTVSRYFIKWVDMLGVKLVQVARQRRATENDAYGLEKEF